jgi:gluconolactonase
MADGLRVDVDCSLCCGRGGGAGNDGVMIFNSSGEPIGRIDPPERCANLCLGAIGAAPPVHGGHAFYSLFMRTQGALGG